MYLYVWGQGIDFCDFLEKHPKNADLFFSGDGGGGVNQIFFNKFC